MALRDDIETTVKTVIDARYEVTDAYVVPDRSSVTFGATAKKMWGRALFIDLRGSRQLLSDHQHIPVLKAHKAFLYAAAKCIRAESGEPRSFGGDSILAFWYGRENDIAKKAVRAAMKIRYAIDEIVNPKLTAAFSDALDFGIGIGQGEIYIGKSGVAGDVNFQDLIWIGWPTYRAFEFGNKASKPYAIWISENVWKAIKDDNSMVYSDNKSMWVYADETVKSGTFRVYKSSYRWQI